MTEKKTTFAFIMCKTKSSASATNIRVHSEDGHKKDSVEAFM